MNQIHVVKKNKESLLTISKEHAIDINKIKTLNPTIPEEAVLKIGQKIKLDWTTFRLSIPKVVAIAKDKFIETNGFSTVFPDKVNIRGVAQPCYGQDIQFSNGRAAPFRQEVGTTPIELRPKMEKLLTVFSSGDKSGMARDLFSKFLQKQNTVVFFDHPALNMAAEKHPNIRKFCEAALSPPSYGHAPSGRRRIHQALSEAGWDIDKIIVPSDLGVPAFNNGNKAFSTGDFNNGLGVMINGVQYAYVIAKKYAYSEEKSRYDIELQFIFYDVFGLDDDDVREFGIPTHLSQNSNVGKHVAPASDQLFPAQTGITAWWQLQHQHGYPPLVTRIVVNRSWSVSTR